MKFKDLKLGDIFRIKGHLCNYMRINTYEQKNAVCLERGLLNEINFFTDVEKIDVDIRELIEEAIGGEA